MRVTMSSSTYAVYALEYTLVAVLTGMDMLSWQLGFVSILSCQVQSVYSGSVLFLVCARIVTLASRGRNES